MVKQRYQIDYIEFPPSAPAQTRQFMGDAFGWTFTDYGPGYAAIDNAGIDGGVDGSPNRPTAPLAVIRTDDLELAEREVLAAGGEITLPAFDFPGGRRFHFREPGGVELAVWIARS